jgi:outer membrane protein assembly factor BamB
MSHATTVCVAVYIAALAVETRAGDWPTYQHSNDRVAATDESLAAPLVLRWTYSTPAAPRTAWSGPRNTPIEGLIMRHRVRYDDALHVVAAGEKAYFGSQVDHRVYCVDASTGEPHWTFFTEGPIRLAPTIADGRVFFGSDDGHVYCLNAADGQLVWRHRPAPRDERLLARGDMISRWPIRTGVLVDDGVAYFGAGIFPHETVYLCAVDAATGKEVWKNDAISQQDAGRNDLSPQGYLLASEKVLFVPSGRSLPVAFDKQTGEMLFNRKHAWRTSAGGEVGGTAALLADGQIFASGSHHFLALDQRDGNVGQAWIPGYQMTFADDKAIVATGAAIIKVDRRAHAKASVERQELFLKLREVKEPAQRAEIEAQRAKLAQVGIEWTASNKAEGAVMVAGDLAFAGGQGSVTAYGMRDGAEPWRAEVKGEVRGLAVADGVLFVSTTAGKIYAYVPQAKTPADSVAAQYPADGKSKPFDDDVWTKTYADAAQQILDETQVKRGFCLVVGGEQGRLAAELAARSELKIYCVEPDGGKVAAARAALSAAGLYGHRITFVQCPLDRIPFSNYFANLVVSDTLIATGKLPVDPAKIARHVKPLGGRACLGAPADSQKPIDNEDRQEIASSLQSLYARDAQTEFAEKAAWAMVTRGALNGAGEWSHQYGDPGNTSNSHDQLVKGGLGVLWYGDPGPSQMVNRHEAANAPLSVGGRMFVQGVESIMCYDAYNGLFLWERKNPGAMRTGVYNNEEPSNLAASSDALFMCTGDTCSEIDAATGEVRREHKTPPSSDDLQRAWGYVAVVGDQLFGTSTVPADVRRQLRRRGTEPQHVTDALFAIDLSSGERKWSYAGKNIMHQTIAIDGGRVFLIDSSITSEERERLLREDKSHLEQLEGAAREAAEKDLKRRDLRLAVALDSATGEVLWSQPVDVTDCSRVGIGGGQITLMAEGNHVVVCGANANGHFWTQFLAGEFSKRRLVVLDAKTGEKRWAKDANYRHRPIVVDDRIIAEPWAFDIASGDEIRRTHPLTGEPTKWSFSRPGHHCGAISASPNMLFFRSGSIGYYDLYSDRGTSHFAGQRPGCWINALPSNGLVVIPEASAGCVCLFSIASTVVLEPRDDRVSWGLYSAQGATTPVKHLTINFGAPGDRRDDQGRLWLAYPRPQTVGRLEYVFDLKPKLAPEGGYYNRNSESLAIEGTTAPWVFASGARGLLRCEIPLLGDGDDAANYRVKLYFAALDDAAAEAQFDIAINDRVVEKELNVARAAGGANRALVKTYQLIPVSRGLVLELRPGDGKTLPEIAGVEVTLEDR